MERSDYTEKMNSVLRVLVYSVLGVGNSWTEQEIFFVDFEGSQQSGVLEYGVVEIRGTEIVGTHSRLCQAVGHVRAEDAAVHGLTVSAVASYRPFAEEWEFFAGLRERGPLAAHYAGVENSLLKQVWAYPRNSPDFARPGERVIDWGPWIDSARLYAQFYPALKTGRLEELVEQSGLKAQLDALAEKHCPPGRQQFHAALYDALAGALLLTSLAKDPRLAELSLTQLLALSTFDPEKRDRLQQRELF